MIHGVFCDLFTIARRVEWLLCPCTNLEGTICYPKASTHTFEVSPLVTEAD